MGEPLTTPQELAVWLQVDVIPDDQMQFALAVLAATAVVIRDAGSIWWTHDTIPPRAKVIADLKAKNFFEHPTGAVNETVGPISERFLDAVVQQIELTDAERALLASLAGDDADPTTPPQLTGIWGLSTTRGPLETHNQAGGGVIYVQWGDLPMNKLLPYWAAGTIGAPEDVTPIP